jgi:hypothetical protein
MGDLVRKVPPLKVMVGVVVATVTALAVYLLKRYSDDSSSKKKPIPCWKVGRSWMSFFVV